MLRSWFHRGVILKVLWRGIRFHGGVKIMVPWRCYFNLKVLWSGVRFHGNNYL